MNVILIVLNVLVPALKIVQGVKILQDILLFHQRMMIQDCLVVVMII